ncbi:hypothetical protein AGABI2DRAFT_178789 [Agaricus bisporus var. bisporus H97]|uniref:hypothetical protein n=1 Tax=Agaricus bisporus var. bisporus (strain H97 / ATCC MYA-4626 / FGSC 10389) TaxID=936046 RepID=UPI00029F5014|nr:hypothetical protein AGABI2DRAFT_178789 [Agaricus bisporus var. bisporus H97]EKV46436.1 hypothetical protein AGABI2DRAFT_178789 [Agaricus bisporus var. bisporus H97]
MDPDAIARGLFTLRVTCGTCVSVAILTTLVRITVRLRRQSRVWVDDALAVLSSAALIIQLVVVFLDPVQHNGVVRYYLISNMFYAAIWSARLSILFSLIRITQNLRSNRIFYIFGAIFLLTWLVLTAQLYWECEAKSAWKEMKVPQCDLSSAVAICQIIADLMSDMSLVHAAYIFQSKAIPILIAAFVENSVSLIVCNIPIMVMAVVKFQENKHTRVSTRSATIPMFKRSINTGQSAPRAVAKDQTSVVNVQFPDSSASNSISTYDVDDKS